VHFEFAQIERFLEVIRVLVAAKAQDRKQAQEEQKLSDEERKALEQEREALVQRGQWHDSQHNLQWRYIGIRLMVQPGNGSQAEELLQKLRALPHFAEEAVVNVSPVLAFSPEYDTDFESVVPSTYSETERSLFD
jgi:outer membrane PBP1 activator LpoA protein